MADDMNGRVIGAPDGVTYVRVSYEDEERVRVAVYVRSAAQSAEGNQQVLAQLAAVTRYADEAGYQVVRTYIETGVAGPEWPAVAQLLDDAASSERDFDAVVVWSYSRLSRNVRRFITLRRTLSDAGVRLVSVTEPTGETNLGEMLRELGVEPENFYIA